MNLLPAATNSEPVSETHVLILKAHPSVFDRLRTMQDAYNQRSQRTFEQRQNGVGRMVSIMRDQEILKSQLADEASRIEQAKVRIIEAERPLTEDPTLMEIGKLEAEFSELKATAQQKLAEEKKQDEAVRLQLETKIDSMKRELASLSEERDALKNQIRGSEAQITALEIREQRLLAAVEELDRKIRKEANGWSFL